MIFAVIIGIILLVVWIKGESRDCLQNPFIYGIDNLNDGDLQCECRNDRGGVYEFNGTTFIPKATNINYWHISNETLI